MMDEIGRATLDEARATLARCVEATKTHGHQTITWQRLRAAAQIVRELETARESTP